MKLIDRINLYREKRFKEQMILERKAFELKAINWWWNILTEEKRRILNHEYNDSINLFEDSGCDGSIIWIYEMEIQGYQIKQFKPLTKILFIK